MKKAEEMTTAKNYREALNLLGQAKAHANEAQLKGIEEKIQAVDKEMNKGSLFDLMEQQPQPEQQSVVQNRTQPQPQQVKEASLVHFLVDSLNTFFNPFQLCFICMGFCLSEQVEGFPIILGGSHFFTFFISFSYFSRFSLFL